MVPTTWLNMGPRSAARVLGLVDLGAAHEGLTDGHVVVHGQGGHPDVDAELAHRLGPGGAGQVDAGQLTGEAEVPANGLAHPAAVQGPGEGIGDGVGYGAVVFVAHVKWGHVAELVEQGFAQVAVSTAGVMDLRSASTTTTASAPNSTTLRNRFWKLLPLPRTPGGVEMYIWGTSSVSASKKASLVPSSELLSQLMITQLVCRQSSA